MKITVLLLAILLAAASLMPFVRREAWWIRVFDFPRAQILVLGLLVFGLALIYWDPWSWQGAAVLIAAGVPVMVEAANIYPYTPFASKEVLAAADADPAATVSLLVATVLMSNRRTERLLAMVAEYRPDIVLLLEPDAWWEARMRALEDVGYEYVVKEPRDNKYGMLLYSRLLLIEPRIEHILRQGVPSVHTRLRLRSGREVWLHAVHPEPPSPTEADTSLPRDAELLIVARNVKGRDTPTIVAGDLNDVAWSHTTKLFQKISGLLDPRKGRGMFNTFTARVPLLRWPLDHIFHSEHFLLAEIRRLGDFGSDHFPVYARLVLAPEAKAVQDAPAPTESDAQAAKEKIAQAQRDD